MRKRPEIHEDVFFDVGPPEEEAADVTEPEEEAATATEPDDTLAKSIDDPPARPDRTHIKLSEFKAEEERRRAARESGGVDAGRIGRPPAQEGPKEAVTLYLTEPVAHMLEEVKFRLLTEYDLKTSKSAIADFAIRHGLDDLQAAADDLRRE